MEKQYIKVEAGDYIKYGDEWLKTFGALEHWYVVPEAIVGQKIAKNKVRFFRRSV
jgi:hypothetical protein